MSFSMSQGSQGNGLMMQQPPFRQYESSNNLSALNLAPQIYSVSFFVDEVKTLWLIVDRLYIQGLMCTRWKLIISP